MNGKKYRVAFAAGSRADYGIVRSYIKKLSLDPNIDFSVLATGSLLDSKYGHAIDLVISDGFRLESAIDLSLKDTSTANILTSMGIGLDRFGKLFESFRPDLLILLGDRYEMLSVATAAAMNRIPILHLHGGEATYGNYDEFIRHSITKMSWFHFASTEVYRKRIIQLGESPDRVFYVGALGAENCLSIVTSNVPAEIRNLSPKSYFVVLFHPETLNGSDCLVQISELLKAISFFSSLNFVFLGANADTNSDRIREKVLDFTLKHNFPYYPNLSPDAYHYLVRNSLGLIGNSSSGIIEAPSLGCYSVNIGHRQDGRVKGNSVLDCDCSFEPICDKIKYILGGSLPAPINPYYKPNCADNCYLLTKKILGSISLTTMSPKVFYDL